MRKGMGHTAVSTIEVSSVTLKSWQRELLNFFNFNRVVNTKTTFI